MQTVGQRIKELRTHEGLTQEKFAKRLKGVTRGAVGNWELDQGIKRENLQAIADEFGASFEWLATGRGDMFGPTVVPVGEEFSPDPEPDFEHGVSSLKPYAGQLPGAIPDIDVSAGAGPGGLPLPAQVAHGSGVVYSADAVRGEMVMPDYILGEYTRAVSSRVHMVRVRGDSMESTLAPGDRVLVDTTDTAIGQGGVFVVLDPDGEVLVKRLRKQRGGTIELISDNPKQASEQHPADEIRIIGRAVARLSRL